MEPLPPADGAADQRPDAATGVRRLLSAIIAGFAGLLTLGLLLGGQVDTPAFAVVVFGVQVLFVLAWTMGTQPPGPWVVAGVGLAAAVGAALAATLPARASLAWLAYVVVGAFVVGIIGQLVRPGRKRVTESMGATLLVVVGVVALGTLVVLIRLPGGRQSLAVCLIAAGSAIAVARLVDIVVPFPRMSPEVPRGAIGVVLGAMAGTGLAGLAGAWIDGVAPAASTIAGLVTALAAVFADLAVGYAETGRRLAGEAPSLWLARHMQGPLAGFAIAAPAAYVLSVLVLVRGL